jgi:hypothetical protein
MVKMTIEHETIKECPNCANTGLEILASDTDNVNYRCLTCQHVSTYWELNWGERTVMTLSPAANKKLNKLIGSGELKDSWNKFLENKKNV